MSQSETEGRADVISVVVPCHNEEQSLPLLFEEFERVAKELSPARVEFVLVDDGSADATSAVGRELAAAWPGSQVLTFSRNFGKEAAIYAGLQHAKGDYVALMDADLQDPPALLPEMYRIIREEDVESVATRRKDRAGEPPIRSAFARLFYRMINRMSETELVDGARDYRLMSRKFVDAVLSLGSSAGSASRRTGWNMPTSSARPARRSGRSSRSRATRSRASRPSRRRRSWSPPWSASCSVLSRCLRSCSSSCAGSWPVTP